MIDSPHKYRSSLSSIIPKRRKRLYTNLLGRVTGIGRDSHGFISCQFSHISKVDFPEEGFALNVRPSPPLQSLQPEYSVITNCPKKYYSEYRVDILAHLFFRDLCSKCTFTFEALFVDWLLLWNQGNRHENTLTT